MKTLTVFAKSLFALGALLACAAPLLAQTPATPAAPATPIARRQGRMAKDLNLTKAQKAQMKAIMQGARAQRQALRANAALTPAQKKAQSHAVAQNTMTKMQSVLTPQQFAKLKAERAAQSKRGTAK